VAVAGEGVDQLVHGGADDRVAPLVQDAGAEGLGDQGAVALVLGRVHLQDGPAHDLPDGHRVGGRGEPHVVGEHLLRELVAGDGEQGCYPWRLLVVPVPAAARPRAQLDVHDRSLRPDPGEHRIGVTHVPGELGELRHRIVAGLGGTILLGRHDSHGNVDDVTESPPDLKGIRALVTGGTSGLGFAMSQALAEAGARVALTARTEPRVQDAVTRIARGDQVTGLVMDVRDEYSVTAGVDRALTRLGGIDVLVNNAGIGMRTVNPHFMTEPIGFWQVSPDGFRDLLTTNIVGYFLVARAVVPHMLEAGHGKIVNISVSETTMRRRGFTPYGPSRAATDALSHIMAADLAGAGIDVNLLLPGGATRSGMTPDSAPEDVQATWLDPAIMGPPVVWLASPASDGITDQRIIATEFAA
jgi:gluconate 5-dehydrogenase